MTPKRCHAVRDRLTMMMVMMLWISVIQTTITVATNTNSSNISTSQSSLSLTTNNVVVDMEMKSISLQSVQNNNTETKMTLYDKYFHKERDNILKLLDIRTSQNRRQLRRYSNLNSMMQRRRISSKSSGNSSSNSSDSNNNYDRIKSCIESSMEQCPSNQYKNGSFIVLSSENNNKKNGTGNDYVKLINQVQSYMNVSFQQIINKINTSLNDDNVETMIDFINLLQRGINDYQDRMQQLLLQQQQSNITDTKNNSYQNDTKKHDKVDDDVSSDISDKTVKDEKTLTNTEALVINKLNTLQNSIYSMLIDTQKYITIMQSSSLSLYDKTVQQNQLGELTLFGIIGFIGVIILGIGSVVLGVVVVGLAIVIIIAIGLLLLLGIGAAIIVPIPLIFLLILGIISWLNNLQEWWENKHNNTNNTTNTTNTTSWLGELQDWWENKHNNNNATNTTNTTSWLGRLQDWWENKHNNNNTTNTTNTTTRGFSSMIDNSHDFSLLSLLILLLPPNDNIFDNDDNTDQYNYSHNTIISLQSMIDSIESDVWFNEFISSKETSLITTQLQTRIFEKQQQQIDLKLFDKSSSSSLCQLQHYIACIMEE